MLWAVLTEVVEQGMVDLHQLPCSRYCLTCYDALEHRLGFVFSPGLSVPGMISVPRYSLLFPQRHVLPC